ncbi:MAG: hypothetical protein PVI86_11620 [Phycisphaerae bacterium]|jgi:hypothetical protein
MIETLRVENRSGQSVPSRSYGLHNQKSKHRVSSPVGVAVCAAGLAWTVIAPPAAAGEPQRREFARVYKGDPGASLEGLQVVTPQGGLLIVGVKVRIGELRTEPAYLALWSDLTDNLIHVYDEPLHTDREIGRAAVNLARDFDVDLPELGEVSA